MLTRIQKYLRDEIAGTEAFQNATKDNALWLYYEAQLYAFRDALSCTQDYSLAWAKWLCDHGAELASLAPTHNFQGQQWAYERAAWIIGGGWQELDRLAEKYHIGACCDLYPDAEHPREYVYVQRYYADIPGGERGHHLNGV